jgi:hypothetical protein
MGSRTALAAAAACLASAWSAAPALAGPCGLPDAKPLWIDYAEGSVLFRNELFGRPGVIAATSGRAVPEELRRRGAQTVYWQMNIRTIVGRPLEPADPLSIPGQANALFDRAAASSACATPLIALEELWGSQLRTPWSATNAQYRANVLVLVETLAARGARPFLFVHSRPAVQGEAGEWWRTLSLSADIVYEAYYHGAAVHALGALLGSRRIRLNMRRVVRLFADIGVPRERLGLALGFHSAPGTLGREGLQPLPAWLDYVKWNALAVQQVAAEEEISSVWSWGWAAFSAAGADPDKPIAACTYLWSRDPTLCDAPAMSGGTLDTSREEGPIMLPESLHCGFSGTAITVSALERMTRITGDRETAATVLLARVASRRARVQAREVLRAERRIIARRFRGSKRAYRRALRRRGLSLVTARAILTDELRARKMSRARTLRYQAEALGTAVCRRDELPKPGIVPLSRFVPFLRLR